MGYRNLASNRAVRLAAKERPPRQDKPQQPDCYDYVRRYYSVPAYVGVRVKAGGKDGVIVAAKSDLHYVHIRLDGQKHSNPYHPTDGIEYMTEGRQK